VQHLGAGNRGGRSVRLDVESGALVRVFPVAQHLSALQSQIENSGKRPRLCAISEIRADGTIIGSGARKSGGGEAFARGQAEGAVVSPHFFEQGRVLIRTGDNGYVAVILGRRANHRRPADVDVLDNFLVCCPWTRYGCLEGIQITNDEIDRLNIVFLQRLDVFGIVADGEDAAVDAGMQRLDPAVEHLRKAGNFRNVAHGQSGVGQRLARAAGRNQLDLKRGQTMSQLDQSRLITDTE
jgi:hypothetical protein